MSFQKSIMNYPVFTGSLSEVKLTEKLQVIQTINAYAFVIAEQKPLFKAALQNADILLPDGFPIVMAAKILNRKKIKKIAGADIFFHYMNTINLQGGRVFFIGSSQNILLKIQKNAKSDFPNVKVGFYSPPFKPEFSEEDSIKMKKTINDFKPDIVFVGMTAPKQEIWVEENKHGIKAKAICSIGAVFDFYAGTIKRAPKWIIASNMEWFYRFACEPKRMWKRYFVYSPLFFGHLLLFKFIQHSRFLSANRLNNASYRPVNN